jgi:DNA-binding NtrC family response regulator
MPAAPAPEPEIGDQPHNSTPPERLSCSMDTRVFPKWRVELDPTNLQRVLVVEDDRALCSALVAVARGWGAEAWEAHTVAEARALLERDPELLIVDLWLEGESAAPFVKEAAHHWPAPAILAISGRASPAESFELGALGVRGFLAKPLFKEQLVEKVGQALREAPDIAPLVAAHVGKTPLKGLLSEVRNVMIGQAIAQSGGSRSGAARLLQVTRQAIQQVFHRKSHDDPPGSEGPRPPGS